MLTIHDTARAVDIIYLDFKKAFDKVPHRRLMAKVRALGVQGTVAAWLECWLSERQQRVVVDGASSRWSQVTSGVPQGSVLGPLLFLIYINDLDVGIISRISKFADDTKLGTNAANADAVHNMQQDLARIGEWSERWHMPFNLEKCKVMHVGATNPNANYSLLGSELATTTAEKDLGVWITNDFSFRKQSIEAEKRAQKLLGYIARQFRYKEQDTILNLYNALVRPHLEYAVQFWSPRHECDIERLEKVQKRATKLIPAIRHRGYDRRRQALNLFTLKQRRLRGQLIETFKILKGHSSVDSNSLFSRNENPTRRHPWQVYPQRANYAPCRHFMTYSICNVWNGLPTRVVASDTVETFKRRLDRILDTLVT